MSVGTIVTHPIISGGGFMGPVALAALAAIPLVLVFWLYRNELRLVTPAVARLLLGLRLAVVAAILAVVLLHPAVRVRATESVRGRVIVALDRSESMKVADPQRPLAEKLKIARALRLANDLCSDAELDGWIAQPSTGGGSANHENRRKFDRVMERIDGLTRAQIGAAVVQNTDWLKSIERTHDVTLLGFGDGAAPLSLESLGLPPDGKTTDLGAPIDAALANASAPVAVVLLTDGRQTADNPPAAKVTALAQIGTPLHTVAVAPRTPPPDVAIARLHAPATVFKGSEVGAEIAVQVHNLGARSIAVELQVGGKTVATQRIAHPGGSKLHLLRLPVRIDESGVHNLTARVQPEIEDLHPENDVQTASIQAAEDRAKVLLIDGEARWEFHYLASALARDRGMALTSVVFAQPRIGRNDATSMNDAGLPTRAIPAEPETLDAYDAIVLGDVAPDQLPQAERERLDRYVTERGGTLIVLGGKKAMPGEYFRQGLENDPIRKLLPIEAGKPINPATGFTMALAPEGRLASFLQLGASAELNDQSWAALPKHFWAYAGRAKPGAAVLACDRDPTIENPSDPTAWAKDHAVIARHSVGFGRVLYIGLESTWRFRFRSGDALHHRFWGQVLRWAASDQPLIVGNATVRFGPRKPLVPQGEDVEIGVRWLDAARPLKPGAPAAVRIVRKASSGEEERVADVPLRAVEARPRELEARLQQLAPGEYLAELVIPDRAADLPLVAGTATSLRAGFRVTPRESPELADLSADYPQMEQMAQQTGGRVVLPDQAAELATLLERQTVTNQVDQTWPLDRSWLLLAGLLLLLSFEWTIRKLTGLP